MNVRVWGSGIAGTIGVKRHHDGMRQMAKERGLKSEPEMLQGLEAVRRARTNNRG